MKKYLLFIAALFLVSCVSEAQFAEWGLQMGPDYRGIRPTSVATDTAGNVIYAGTDRVTITNSSIFVRKLNPQGNTIWEFYDGGCESQMSIVNITTDLSGNIYVLGNAYCSELTIKTIHIADSNNNSLNYVLFKLNANGQFVYLTDVIDDVAALKADAMGNCYLTGSAGTQKYDATGHFKWNNTTCAGNAIDVSTFGKVFVTNGTSTWRLNSSGNINWQNLTIGGFGIDYYELLNRIYLVNNTGLTKIQLIGNLGITTHYNQLYGTMIESDLFGNLYTYGYGQINKKSCFNGAITTLVTPSGVDMAVNCKGQTYVLGVFNNVSTQISYCNFTTVQQTDPNLYCLDNCRDDGYIIKVSFNPASLTTVYNYSNVCSNQNNPVGHCSDRQFNAGNTFKVELSDINGNFNNPSVVGVEPYIFIPAGLAASNNYRLRVSSTSPVVTGIPSAKFSIQPSLGAITIAKVGVANLCDSGYVHLQATDAGGNPTICNWYCNDYILNYYVFKGTGTDFNAAIEGDYYAASTTCYNTSSTLFVTYDCRIADPQTNSSLQLFAYPNPSSNNFTIRIEGVTGQGWLSIYDVSGNLVEKISVVPDAVDQIGGGWATGAYIAKVEIAGQTKFIKLMKVN